MLVYFMRPLGLEALGVSIAFYFTTNSTKIYLGFYPKLFFSHEGFFHAEINFFSVAKDFPFEICKNNWYSRKFIPELRGFSRETFCLRK